MYRGYPKQGTSSEGTGGKAAPRSMRKTISYWRNKADSLLTPIIKEMFPQCLLVAPNCARETQVAHHHVHKSKSTRLRYEISNLIPLCHHCHQVLHHNESYWASVIVERKGLEWFRDLERMKQETVKADWLYYQRQYERLQAIAPAHKTLTSGDHRASLSLLPPPSHHRLCCSQCR